MEISVVRGEDTTTAHVMGLFDKATDTLRHLQIEPNTDLELVEHDDTYWQHLSGKHLANFTALRCGGCWANGNDAIVLEFDDYGHFRGWRR